jgi:hypothetical protein
MQQGQGVLLFGLNCPGDLIATAVTTSKRNVQKQQQYCLTLPDFCRLRLWYRF